MKRLLVSKINIFVIRLYVTGGKDIGAGLMSNMWCIDLTDLDKFIPGETEYSINPEWVEMACTGTKPPPMSHHSSLVYQTKMYMFGGSTRVSENLNFYTLDLVKDQWQIIKPKALHGDPENFPKTRDEHSCILQENSMVIFGGFAFGERTNNIFRYRFIDNTWE